MLAVKGLDVALVGRRHQRLDAVAGEIGKSGGTRSRYPPTWPSRMRRRRSSTRCSLRGDGSTWSSTTPRPTS